MVTTDDLLRSTLVAVAPGTPLRDGLERILRGNTGGLIVLGHDRAVEALCTGGFNLDIDFSATRVRELSKMDGGSQSMRIIALYVDGRRYVLDDSAAILSRANQALATLERYKMRLDEVAGTLSALEIEDLVTVRDAMTVSQRLERVRRISGEIDGYVIELGTDGRLLRLQVEELMAGVEGERALVGRDYLVPAAGKRQRSVDDVLNELDALSDEDLLDLSTIAKAFGHPGSADAMELAVSPRGYRLLAKVPRLPALVVDRLVDHFGGLQKLLAAGIDDLQVVDGVGDTRARSVREGLSRLAETSILERYV